MQLNRSIDRENQMQMIINIHNCTYSIIAYLISNIPQNDLYLHQYQFQFLSLNKLAYFMLVNTICTNYLFIFKINIKNCEIKLMKGSVSLNPKFTPLGIKNAKIIKTNPLIAVDGKYLYFKPVVQHSKEKDEQQKIVSVRWQQKDIVNCTYLKNYKIILLLCQNYRVYALTENLQQITHFTGWQSKYSLAFQVIQELNVLLMIGAQTVQLLKVSVDSNIKKTKFLSSMKFSLKKLINSPIIANTTLSWNKGYNYNIRQNLLYVWSPESMSFLNLTTLELNSQSHALTKKQYPITCAFFSAYYKYTLTGVSNGQIRVWRLPLSKKFHHQNILIHTFQGHAKNIHQIVQSKTTQKIIMSSGQDLQVCVWSLQTYQMLRKYQFLGLYSEIYIKNIAEAYVVKDQMIGQLNFGQSLEFITEINSDILQIDKQVANSDVSTLTLTLEENLGLVMQDKLLLVGKDLNKMETKFIYPPLKAKAIKQIISSPYRQSEYFYLVQNGDLFKIQLAQFSKQNTSSSKIIQCYDIQSVIDIEKHPLNQIPTVIDFFPLLPVEFDSQIRDVDDGQEIHSEQQLTNIVAEQAYNELKLIAIGCNKGSIIFLSTDKMSKIYCRLTYHRERIISMHALKQHKTNEQSRMNYCIVSLCAQNYVKVITFDYQRKIANCILTYHIGDELKFMKSFQNYLVFVFYKGQFEITQMGVIGKNVEICCRRSSQIENHQGQILNIDYEKNYELFLTSGTDNKIKIWTTNRIMIYDIGIDEGLTYCCFISHKPKQSAFFNYSAMSEINEGNTDEQKILEKKNKLQQKIELGLETDMKITQEERKLKQIMNQPIPIPVQFDLMLAHANKLLYFNHIPLSFRPNQIEKICQNQQLNDNQKISIRDVFEQFSQAKVKEQDLKTKLSKINDPKIFSSPYLNRSDPQNSFKEKSKSFFQSSLQNNSSSVNYHINSTLKKKTRKLYTQPSPDRSHIKTSNRTQLEPIVFRSKKNKSQKINTLSSDQGRQSYKSLLQKPSIIPPSSIEATKKHLKELSDLRHQININRPLLPTIRHKKQDVFDEFMRQKLVNKNILTRRDITLNRIIMKNIIKEHFEEESKLAGLRLEH